MKYTLDSQEPINSSEVVLEDPCKAKLVRELFTEPFWNKEIAAHYVRIVAYSSSLDYLGASSTLALEYLAHLCNEAVPGHGFTREHVSLNGSYWLKMDGETVLTQLFERTLFFPSSPSFGYRVNGEGLLYLVDLGEWPEIIELKRHLSGASKLIRDYGRDEGFMTKWILGCAREGSRMITFEEASMIAQSFGCAYTEVDLTQGLNVTEALTSLVKDMI